MYVHSVQVKGFLYIMVSVYVYMCAHVCAYMQEVLCVGQLQIAIVVLQHEWLKIIILYTSYTCTIEPII